MKIRLLTLILLLNFFGISIASACSIIVENREGEFDYAHLSNEFIFEEDVKFTDEGALAARNAAKSKIGHSVQISKSIYLVKPVFVPVDMKTEYFGDIELGIVKFEIVEIFKGEKKAEFYLMSDSRSLSLVPNPEKFTGETKKEYESFKKLSRDRHKHHQAFEFWDTQLLVKPEMAFPPHHNSCSVTMISNFVFGDNYLFIGDLNSPKFWNIEPVSGIEDPLVQKVVQQIQTGKWVKQSISPQDYFSQIDYSAPVTLSNCPSGVRREKDINWWDPFTKYSFRTQKTDKNIKPFKSMRGQDVRPDVLEKVNNDWPGIFVYYPDTDKKGVTCKGRENYLVFGYGWYHEGKPQLSRHPELWRETKSNIRYAKIVNGEVLLSSIKTQYAFKGPERIPLETVLSWIPKSDFDPDKWPGPGH